MAIVFKESSLMDSEVFNGINTIDPAKKTHEKAIDLIKTAKHLTVEDIEAAYISVRQITDSLVRASMKAFDNEDIVLIYNIVPSLSITQAIPFLTFKKGNKYVTYVFVDKYVSMSKDGVLSIQPAVLRDLLTSALVANALKTNYSALASSQFMQKLLMEMYTEFVIRILNRDYSIAAEKMILDTVKYWVNRFFLERVMNAADSPENLERLAKAHIKFLDETQLPEITRQYDDANISNVSAALNLIKTASPRMKGLDFRSFLGSWTSYYYAPSLLAIDNIEYFLFMVITLLNGNNIINISASDIVKEAKNIKSFKGELLKLL